MANRRSLTPTEARTFKANKLIIHVVPTNKKDAAKPRQPSLSPDVAPTDTRVDQFFAERVDSTFRKTSVPVEEDSTVAASAVGHVKDILRSAGQLVPKSQELAKELFTVQSAVQPDGLLVVARGNIEVENKRRPAVLVLKLEPEEGANLLRDAKGVYTPEYLNNLMLTGNTKVFKAAVLGTERQKNGSDLLIGCISDEQTQTGAEFFRSNFLGTQPTRNSAVVTRDFFHAASDWIDNNVVDDATHRAYHLALRVEVDSKKTKINVTDFAAAYLEDEHADDFVGDLAQVGVPPGDFEKNLLWIKPIQRRARLETTQGIRVEGDPELVGELVSEREVDGEIVTVIMDRLKR